MKKSLLLVGLIAGVMTVNAEQKLVMDGSTTVGPIAKAFAEYYMRENPGVNITVSESGSGNGAKALLNGSCDIANLSRDLKDAEKAAMKEKGVEPCKHVVAFDALPVIVHPSNRVKGLTIDQVRDIYTGKITNWKEVGGSDRKIVVISRDTNSGTFETFMHLVMGEDAKIKESAEYTGSNGAVRQRVQMTKGAIGYAGLGFVDRSVKPLSINGIEPSADTVVDKTYPLARELYMFTKGTPAKGSLVEKFLDLMKTEKGEEIVEEIGFVPLGAK
ncbi:MAG: phosphate ABC transporter substrate-binding protein [Kiritimatiellae bacterium]|nr:phosphate ABC transporter substrate-binding protein [Kiritimatiellia bacterium]